MCVIDNVITFSTQLHIKIHMKYMYNAEFHTFFSFSRIFYIKKLFALFCCYEINKWNYEQRNVRYFTPFYLSFCYVYFLCNISCIYFNIYFYYFQWHSQISSIHSSYAKFSMHISHTHSAYCCCCCVIFFFSIIFSFWLQWKISTSWNDTWISVSICGVCLRGNETKNTSEPIQQENNSKKKKLNK